jgi:antitoxin MazE
MSNEREPDMQVQIMRWGDSLGLRVPRDVAARLGLKAGARVDIAAEDGRIVISLERPIYGLDELLVGMTPATMREAFDWGPDLGREAVE